MIGEIFVLVRLFEDRRIDTKKSSFTICANVPVTLQRFETTGKAVELPPGTYPGERMPRPDGDWIIIRINSMSVGLPVDIWEFINDPAGTRCEDVKVRVF